MYTDENELLTANLLALLILYVTAVQSGVKISMRFRSAFVNHAAGDSSAVKVFVNDKLVKVVSKL